MECADENPSQLHIYVYTGADGSFTLYEDDNSTNGYRQEQCVRTRYSWQEEEGCFCIGRAEGETSLIPTERDYIITFCGVEDAQVTGKRVSNNNGAELDIVRRINEKERAHQMFSVVIERVPVNEEVVLYLKERIYTGNHVVDRCFQILDRAETAFSLKETVFNVIEAQAGNADLLEQLGDMGLDSDLYSALEEVIIA